MDIRLQNALITKYALQGGASRRPSLFKKPTGELVEPPSAPNKPTSINFDEMNPLAKAQIEATYNPGKTRYDHLRGERIQNVLKGDYDYAAKVQDRLQQAKIEEEEAAGEAAGRASLRGYLNPTTSSSGNMALYAGGGALLGGGLATLLSRPKDRKRNALLYALLGGGLGIGAKMLGDRYAAEPEPESKGLLQSALSLMPKMPKMPTGFLPSWMGGNNVDLVKTDGDFFNPASTTIAGQTQNYNK